ncbi:MAG: hypothetical protein R3279_03790 [Putridiphycobacter sp.]|nr:hypothetical protein [Putridiphycobacter sp.]
MEKQRDPKLVAQEILKSSAKDRNNQRVKMAGLALLLIAILTLIKGLIVGAELGFGENFYLGLVDVLVFTGLYFLSLKKPMTALITGLILYVVPHLYLAFLDPSGVLDGIVLKLILVVILAQGILAAMQLVKIKPKEIVDVLDDF